VTEAARLDRLVDESLERVRGRIPNPPQPDPAHTVAVFLDGDDDQRFLERATTPHALLERAHVRFVDFDAAREALAARPHHRPTQLVQPCPRGLVTAQAPVRALVPVFWLVTHHIARNQTDRDVRVS
jgi:hypothetical protein